MDVSTRQWGRVEGHSHGGSHSGKALGQGGGNPPPELSCPWSWRTRDLGILLVHLYHLGGDTSISELRGYWVPCWPPAGYERPDKGQGIKAWSKPHTLPWTLKARVGPLKKSGELRGREGHGVWAKGEADTFSLWHLMDRILVS